MMMIIDMYNMLFLFIFFCIRVVDMDGGGLWIESKRISVVALAVVVPFLYFGQKPFLFWKSVGSDVNVKRWFFSLSK